VLADVARLDVDASEPPALHLLIRLAPTLVGDFGVAADRPQPAVAQCSAVSRASPIVSWSRVPSVCRSWWG
jgi:hypothetical protein